MSSENFGESMAPERAIPVDASLVTGVLIMIPVMVFSTALGFFLNMWLFWTVPALAGLAIWAVLFSKVRGRLAEEPAAAEADESAQGFDVGDLDGLKNREDPKGDSAKSA
ncbi:hypothetical protein [Arthrobacter russicus]|uniref:Uncharacterized protein n=1 Tax=Arthrobacter russicus TaxID=172040 RepID=A0ABU1J6C8_9MICC|nr:hypothetical protein [Arthrobacter russicus]MDR6267979.1 hypothetical protein [Arthrobacter russicus]